MQATVEREEALRLLGIEHQAAANLIDALSAEEMTRRATIQHGLYADQECSFKDLLAHLICYEVHTVAAIQEWRHGRKHWVFDAVKDVRRSRNLHFGGIADRAHLSLDAQLEEYRRVSRQLEGAIAGLSDADWRAQPPYSKDEFSDLGGMIESVMASPPRPMYRHLPVHVPDEQRYIMRLR